MLSTGALKIVCAEITKYNTGVVAIQAVTWKGKGIMASENNFFVAEEFRAELEQVLF